MADFTRHGLGGPSREYGLFEPKPEASVIPRPAGGDYTRLAVGGPGIEYGVFAAKPPFEGPVGGAEYRLTWRVRRR